MAKSISSENGSKQPILVTGAHRTGTTWVGKMIAQAGNMYYLHEIFNPAADPGICSLKFDKWFYYIPDDVDEPFFTPIYNTLRKPNYDLLRSLREARTLSQYRRCFSAWWASVVTARKPHTRFLLKDPIAVLSTEWLATRFNLRVIIMVRHPAAFASSLKQYGFVHPFQDFLAQQRLMEDWLGPFEKDLCDAPHDIVDQAILLWRILYYVVDKFRAAHPDWLIVEHADLASDPLNGFKRLFKLLQIDWTAEVEEMVASYSSASNRVDSADPALVRRNSAALVKIWKKRLSPDEITRIYEGTSDIWPLYYSEADWK